MFTDLDPSADPRLAAVFAAARAPAELPLVGEPAALTAYRRSQQSRGKSWFRLGNRPAQLMAASLFSTVVLAGSAAAAAAGALPLPIAGHHHHASTAAADSTHTTAAAGSGGDHSTSTVDMTDSGGPGTAGHPAATPTTLGSVAKGVATCTAASHAKCRAGLHGKAAAAHSHRAGHSAHSTVASHAAAHRPAALPLHGLRPDFVPPHALQLRRARVSG